MPADNKTAQASPFEIITPGKSKKGGKTGLIVGVLIVLFLILSVVAGVLLVRQQQNVAEKASTDLISDNNNCGSLGHVCSVGSVCRNGACVLPATPTPTPSPTPTPTPLATPTPTPTGSQNACNGACGSNLNCQTGLYCYSGYCRNPLCASDSTCGCSAAASPTPTPTGSALLTPTPTPTGTAIVMATATATPFVQTSPIPIPVTGVEWPTMLGIGFGAFAILISLLIAI